MTTNINLVKDQPYENNNRKTLSKFHWLQLYNKTYYVFFYELGFVTYTMYL